MTGAIMKCTYQGRLYNIPEIWVMGFCQDGSTILEAVQWWVYQQHLKEIEEGEA